MRHRRCGWRGNAALGHARQTHDFLAFLDFKLGEIGCFQQVDQLLDFAQVHAGPRAAERTRG